ncbi:MAG: DUF493 domain-containing protein [Cytophagales bacterium]|nr:DUF493 domain-containing protein [Cytophagales bacterium]
MKDETNDSAIQQFKEKLEAQHKFPGKYKFKFIVAQEKKAELLSSILPGRARWQEKPSRNGKYLSMTAEVKMKSSEEVVAVYVQAKKIEGIISL